MSSHGAPPSDDVLDAAVADLAGRPASLGEPAAGVAAAVPAGGGDAGAVGAGGAGGGGGCGAAGGGAGTGGGGGGGAADGESKGAGAAEEELRVPCDPVASAAMKAEGNRLFGHGEFAEASGLYSRALDLCPSEVAFAEERAKCFSNRAACYIRLGRFEEAAADCTAALGLKPDYEKALARRGATYEKMDRLEDALRDYNAAGVLHASAETTSAAARVGAAIEERNEKMKAEMMDKLKGLANTVLGKFGMSTDNFKATKDPATGSYSINFQK